MVELNASWCCSDGSLNPRLIFVNSNSITENKALLEWATVDRSSLINFEEYSEHDLKLKRKWARHSFKRALKGKLDIEMDDCRLRGFGTLAENKLYAAMYEDELNSILITFAEDFAQEHAFREAEREAEEKECLGGTTD